MTSRSTTLFVCGLLIGLIACGATAFRAVRAAASKQNQSSPAQVTVELQRRPARKNLALQPEAFKVARRLGSRFSSGEGRTSVVAGTLRIGPDIRDMQMTRTQTSNGESVEISVTGSQASLVWDAERGGLSSASQVNENDRELIERLVFDSPDQFVLMQLRGASYSTIAKGVRPAEAADGYTGPLWTIVRVDDPEPDETKRALSPWRLYYLNTRTGLIDRIESEARGQRIVAEISSWTDQGEEKVPAQIVWTAGGQKLMQYTLTTFSLSSN